MFDFNLLTVYFISYYFTNYNVMKNYNPAVGIELEFMIIDYDGNPVNKQENLLGKGTGVVEEVNLSQIELSSHHHSSITDLKNDLLDRLNGFLDECKKSGFRLTPVMDFVRNKNAEIKSTNTIISLRRIMGGDVDDLLKTVKNGFHMHIDRGEHDDEVVKQINLLIATDPFFALLNANPYYEGKHDLIRDHRVDIYRNKFISGHLAPFFKLPHYLSEQEKPDCMPASLYNKWISMLAGNKLPSDGFSKYTTSWAPLRLREKTIEDRKCSSNNLELVIAMAAFNQALMSFSREPFNIMIGTYNGGNFVKVNTVNLPGRDFIDALIKEALHTGIASSDILSYYVREVLDAVSNIASNEQLDFINPLYRLTKGEPTLSERILRETKSSEVISSQEAKRLYLLTADWFEESIY